MKTVLILTASTGDGHNQAAASLADAFKINGYNVIKYDFINKSSRFISTCIVDGYRLLAFKYPRVYGDIYKLSDSKKFNSKISKIRFKNIENGIRHVIKENNPDIIITTHAFAVSIISRLKKNNIVNVPFISIVTDFKAHYAYIDEEVDAYITGSEYTKLCMVDKKVPQYKVFPYGIPIRKDFFINRKIVDKIHDEYFNILLMAGSMGIRFMEPVLEKLVNNQHKLKIVVVCGKNTELYNTLKERYRECIKNIKIDVLSYTKNIPVLMDEADVIITKPGGITVSEAIAKRLPMLLPYAIPGQEQENMEFLLGSGTAVDISNLENLNATIDDLIEHPEILKKIRENQGKLFENYSVKRCVELSDNLIKNNKIQNIS